MTRLNKSGKINFAAETQRLDPWKLNSRDTNTQPIVNSAFPLCGKSKRRQRVCRFRKNRKKSQTMRLAGQNFNIRVWSWLRMNAGGVLNTCKSSGDMKSESFGRKISYFSGGRVSNVWATCPVLWNNHWKRWLIPHVIARGHPLARKGFIRYRMGPHLIS